MSQNIEFEFDKNIQYIKGVGPKKAELLNKMGIYNIKDLIEYYPRNYEDRTKLSNIIQFVDGESYLFIGTLSDSIHIQRIRKNLTIYSTFVYDETGECKMTWFNQKYINTKLHKGDKYLFYGKAVKNYGMVSMESPQIYNLNDIDKIQGLYPIYPLTAGITQNYLFKLENDVFKQKPIIPEFLSNDFRKKYGLCEINYATENVHFPKTFNAVNDARNRLIFDELFLLELALMSVKESSDLVKKTNKFKKVDISKFLKLLPFSLTNAQKRVVDEIEKDMLSDRVMNRLIQGDVGSGKTMVAAISMYIAVKNGYQAAMMAPTTILANQHFDELSKYFEKLGIKSDIITSSTTKKNKRIICEKLVNKEIDIIIGTHSLIEDGIEFNNLGLVITDEQHRFGVKQREALHHKGNKPHIIVMSATPIPRSLAIILYGDLDISVIDEKPAMRLPIKNCVVDDSYRPNAYRFIQKELDKGHQAYIICPMAKESDEEDNKLENVVKYAAGLKEKFPPQVRIEYLHGKLKPSVKNDIMERFAQGQIDILVSTTVVEVGINVPNATVMVVENADRFGLAGLHQLRGRVGRGDAQSYCIFISNTRNAMTKERLNILKESNDGFYISEQDLKLRGPGDMLGVRQSGDFGFMIADIYTDAATLKLAADEADKVMERFRGSDPEYDKLRYAADDYMRTRLDNLNI